ncbi:PQQ-dependent sugar dehydrogenase [Nocardioides sp. CER19]|uniref:PQQ-dependent sugar dehydrogenase n=1 Tax=Nocardioides sp. CER19 TaxID=3038538 RepID=UPI00244C1CDD|nr:PQQ-dependent sugar dehydrogenase [Nocardioides sp. CER19]MDH2413030.1 PQQ-dependent sugar dehydrogenase [Nocardioides sp. CER19]
MGDLPASRRAVLSASVLAPLLAACGSPRSERHPPAAPASPTSSPASAPAPTPASPTTSAAPSPPAPASGPPRLRQAGTIAEDLAVPWGIAFLPDGSALVGERDTARVLRVASGRSREIGSVPGVVSTVDEGGEGGLLGLALHPSGDWLYAYHSTADDNRVVRMSFDGRSLGRPQVVLDGIATAIHHNGGGLRFAPDGLLFVSTGDAEDSSRSQDTGSLNGKVLRVTDRGGVPSGNPFGNRVWSYGHRNVEGLAFDAEKRLWASEFGDKGFDELNLIVKGGNYGWPEVEGSDGAGGFRDPIAQWPTDECSPSGIAVVGGYAFLGALRGECVWSVDLASGKSRRWLEGHGRIRMVAAAPDGSLWVGTSNKDGRGSPSAHDDRIFRVTI